MDEEQQGVDYFTFDSVQELLKRTNARRNRLNQAKDGASASTSSTSSIGAKSTSTVKSVSGRGSPLRAVNSNGSLISCIPSVDEPMVAIAKAEGEIDTKSSVSITSVTQENPGPISSILKKEEEDLPHYKVEIQSRFSPKKKPSAPVYRPSPSTLNKPAEIRVSSIALPMPAKATASKVEPKPCRIPSTSKISETVRSIEEKVMAEKKAEEKTFEVPESAPISARIKNLQKLFGAQNSEPESPAPEKLPVLAKKRLFERKIKEEATMAQEGIKRNEYLAQKRGLSSTDISAQFSTSGNYTHTRPSIAGMVGNGKVKKMLEKLTSPDTRGNSWEEEEEIQVPKPRRSSRVSFKLPSPSASALNHFDEIDQLSEANSDAFSPPLVPNVYLNAVPTTSHNDSDDDMELDSQSSQENSPKKSYYNNRDQYEDDYNQSSKSNSLYPNLPPVEEADSVHSSPSKRTRFQDDYADDERFTSSEETDFQLLNRKQSSASIPLHEAIEREVNQKLGGTPMRTLSQFRMEQKKKAQVDASVIPKIVYGTMKRDERGEALAERERYSRIQQQITKLRKEEVSKYEAMIEQTSNLLNQLKPYDFGTDAHADSERHLKVLGLKRIAAMNEAHRLQSILSKKPPTDFVTGSIDFERIDVPIDHELRLAYSHGLATKQNVNQYYFVAVSYSGVVHASECRTLKEGISSEFLSFKLPHGLKITGVRHDFEVKIEIYGWSVIEDKHHTSKGLKSKLTPKKSKKEKHVPSPAGPMAIRNSQFTLRGSLTLTHKNLLKKKHTLTEFLDKSLNGTLDLQVKLEPEFKKSYTNFLHFYEDVEGSWRRRWAKLEGHKLMYWLTPESAERSDHPAHEIDMKLCINPFIARLPSDVCPRKNSFSLILASYPDKTANRVNYLLNKNYSSVTRMFVAADVSEDCDEWIDQIASLIEGMRLWDPQALRACSVADFDRYVRAD